MASVSSHLGVRRSSISPCRPDAHLDGRQTPFMMADQQLQVGTVHCGGIGIQQTGSHNAHRDECFNAVLENPSLMIDISI